jgi:hypothetical protein
VDAVAQRHVAVELAADVEAIGVGELALVAIRTTCPWSSTSRMTQRAWIGEGDS